MVRPRRPRWRPLWHVPVSSRDGSMLAHQCSVCGLRAACEHRSRLRQPSRPRLAGANVSGRTDGGVGSLRGAGPVECLVSRSSRDHRLRRRPAKTVWPERLRTRRRAWRQDASQARFAARARVRGRCSASATASARCAAFARAWSRRSSDRACFWCAAAQVRGGDVLLAYP